MHTNTATAPIDFSLARTLRAFLKELRRAFELAGAPYADGTLPPL